MPPASRSRATRTERVGGEGRRRRGSGRAGLVPCLLLWMGCAAATPEFHSHFEAGRYLEAAATFEADTALLQDERALFRAGVVHGIPDSPAYDPPRARWALERLLSLHPETEHRAEAARLLSLLRESERMERHLEERRQEVRRATAELAEVRERMAALERRLDERDRQMVVLRRLAERLDAQLREREREVESLREELDQLMDIDLGRNREPPDS